MTAASEFPGSEATHDHDGEKRVLLDSRLIPHAVRHSAIFGALDALEDDAYLDLILDHRPTPLIAQLDARYPGVWETEYLIDEPAQVVVRFSRLDL